jgi:hypothetical protein
MTTMWTPDAGLLGMCADAVLRFQDGSTLECSRFVVSAACPVLRVITDEAMASDVSDTRHVFPVYDDAPDPRAKYLPFVDVIHRIRNPGDLTFNEAVNAYECADKLGAAYLAGRLLGAAWAAAPIPKIMAMRDLLPALIRSDLAPILVGQAYVELPLWLDLVASFLTPLAPYLGEAEVGHLLELQLFYPPAAVALWLLGNVHPADPATALRIATSKALVYTPTEARGVYAELARQYKVHGWDEKITRLAAAIVDSLDVHQTHSSGMSGTGLSATRMNLESWKTTVVVHLEGDRRRRCGLFRVCKLLRMYVSYDGTFYFEFQPGDLLTPRIPKLITVRLTAARDPSFFAPLHEAWYIFRNPTAPFQRSGAPAHSIGRVPDFAEHMVNIRQAMYLRFDFRWSLET